MINVKSISKKIKKKIIKIKCFKNKQKSCKTNSNYYQMKKIIEMNK